MNLFIRIIKRQNCPICEPYLPRLTAAGVEFSIYDADATENQDELDKWNIDELPVVQITDENNNVKFQFPPGTFSPRNLNYKMQEIAKNA